MLFPHLRKDLDGNLGVVQPGGGGMVWKEDSDGNYFKKKKIDKASHAEGAGYAKSRGIKCLFF